MRFVVSGVLAIALLAACSGSGGSPGVPLPHGGGAASGAAGGAPVSTTVYFNSAIFDNLVPATIWGFNGGGSGPENPSQTISDPSAPTTAIGGIATDAAGNIYTAYLLPAGSPGETSGTEIAEYAAGGASSRALRTIRGSATQLNDVFAIAVSADGTLFVLQRGAPSCNGKQQLLVFAPGASGNVAPARIISGSTSHIDEAAAYANIAVDSAGNAYLGGYGYNDNDEVLVYSSSQTGNAPPSRVITGPNTRLGFITGIATTPMQLSVLLGGNPNTSPAVLNFPLNANGNVAPSSTIALTVSSDDEVYDALATDINGNYYVGGYYGASGSPNFVDVFAPGASGFATPLNTFNPTVNEPPTYPNFTMYGPIAVH